MRKKRTFNAQHQNHHRLSMHIIQLFCINLLHALVQRIQQSFIIFFPNVYSLPLWHVIENLYGIQHRFWWGLLVVLRIWSYYKLYVSLLIGMQWFHCFDCIVEHDAMVYSHTKPDYLWLTLEFTHQIITCTRCIRIEFKAQT